MFASKIIKIMDKSLNTTSSSPDLTGVHATTYEVIRNRCKRAKISLTKLCREAGVNRSVLEDWKRSEPKTLRILHAFNEVLLQAELDMSQRGEVRDETQPSDAQPS